MIDPTELPAAPEKILVIRLDALGDIVLGTMLLSGLHAKWPSAKMQLLVRPQMTGVAALLPDWVEVVALAFDPRQPIGSDRDVIVRQLRDQAAELRSDVAVVAEFSRTWAGEIIADICGAPTILAFDGARGLNFQHREICADLGVGSLQNWKLVAADADEREASKYQKFLRAIEVDPACHVPSIVIRAEDRAEAAGLWEQIGADPQRTIVCFPGSGEGIVRSLDAAAWSRWIGRLKLSRPVVLLGSEADAPVLNAIETCGLPPGVATVRVPTEKVGVTAAFIERGGGYVGMDTGPMHIAAVLDRPTLGVFGGGHRAERFLPVGRRAAAVRMPLGCYGCEWFCPFDTRLCVKEIPEWPLCEAADQFLNDALENPDPFSPRIFDVAAPAELPSVLLGPIMRQHRRFLALNHQLNEHHDYLNRTNADHQARLVQLTQFSSEVARQNHERGQDVERLSNTLAEMSRQNASRDNAIAHLSATIAEMTKQNESRDGAIQHVNETLAEMSRQNAARNPIRSMFGGAFGKWFKK